MNITAIALVISTLVGFGTLVVLILSTRNKATNEYITILEKRIKDLEDRMIKCEEARNGLVEKNTELQQENTALLRKIIEAGVIEQIKKKK